MDFDKRRQHLCSSVVSVGEWSRSVCSLGVEKREMSLGEIESGAHFDLNVWLTIRSGRHLGLEHTSMSIQKSLGYPYLNTRFLGYGSSQDRECVVQRRNPGYVPKFKLLDDICFRQLRLGLCSLRSEQRLELHNTFADLPITYLQFSMQQRI